MMFIQLLEKCSFHHIEILIRSVKILNINSINNVFFEGSNFAVGFLPHEHFEQNPNITIIFVFQK